MSRIFLSPPYIGEQEERAVVNALQSGWVAPVGPAIDEFELALKEGLGYNNVLCLNSGTSALHLAVRLAGIQKGDKVLIGTFTFIAAANAVCYEGGVPVFVDSEDTTWNLDPELLEQYLMAGGSAKAVIVTHIFGRPAQIERIASICQKYDLILIEDAAEAIGAKVGERYVGGFGDFGVLSFNGNKLITTSGGGAIICRNQSDHHKAKFLSEQAKENAPYFEHKEVGYNYRMSNILASIGLVQFSRLSEFAKRKQEILGRYKLGLEGSEYFKFVHLPKGYVSNYWLSTFLINPMFSVSEIVEFLDSEGVESRRFWKPLHLQPLYADAEIVGGAVSEGLFEHGICLPSGAGLSIDDQDKIIDLVKAFIRRKIPS